MALEVCYKEGKLWRKVVEARWGDWERDGGRRGKYKSYGVSLWKKICGDSSRFLNCIGWQLGNGRGIRFWQDGMATPFKQIWRSKAPPRMTFLSWEVSRESISTMDMLRRRGNILINRCYMRKADEESCNHLLLWCLAVHSILIYVFGIMGMSWVMAGNVSKELWVWVGICRKKKQLLLFPLTIF